MMKILYSAIDQSVPAAHGGSVHVTAVAEGLAELGHDVHVLVSPGDRGEVPTGKAQWFALPPPIGNRRLRLLRAPAVASRARQFRPDVVIERYYNFGGEAILAAKKVGALAVLEVNAPIVDHPGSLKRLVDRALIVEPMRRWRDWQCRQADVIVTPSAKILPAYVPATAILRTEWGADTNLFRPGATGRVPFARKRRRRRCRICRRLPRLARCDPPRRSHPAPASAPPARHQSGVRWRWPRASACQAGIGRPRRHYTHWSRAARGRSGDSCRRRHRRGAVRCRRASVAGA